MRQIIVGIGTALLFAAGAQAAAICAAPQELRSLQAAVLQQQLAAAAQSCHAGADYSRFVAAYRAAIVRSDTNVRRFFERHKAGESYEAYKSRIAHDVSLESLHDARFCAAAKAVFNLALGRSHGSAPPALVRTGYESCRPIADKPVFATVPQPKPVPSSRAAEVVPVPTPAPLGPRALAAIAAIPAPLIVPPTRLAAMAPPPALASRPAVMPIVSATSVAEPAPRAPETAETDDWGNVPNAYQPGSRWVGAEVKDPSPWRWQENQPANLYRGPDGRWYVRISRHDRWSYGD